MKTTLKRFEMSALAIEESIFDVYIDTERRELHILDLDLYETRTVTNNAHQNFILAIEKYLKTALGLAFDDSLIIYNIFLYGTDGVASLFEVKTNLFHPVDPLRALYPPFDYVLRDRYADAFFGMAKRIREERG